MLSYIEQGGKHLEPLLFIHGLGMSKEYWLSQQDLSKSYRCVYVDLLGHGKSQCTKPATIREQAISAIKLLDYLNIDSTHILGHSLGGVVAQEIYRQDKMRVNSLILSNTFSYAPPLFPFLEVFFREMKLKGMSKEGYLECVIDRCLYNKDNQEFRSQMKKGASFDEKCYLESAYSCTEIDYLFTLCMMKIPVLVIGGKYDLITPEMFAWQTYGSLFSSINSKIHIFDQCGHAPSIEKAEEFNSIVLSFLGGL